MMQKTIFSLEFQEAADLSELSEVEQRLVKRAREMTKSAYAPYSGFFVGAAIYLANGEIVVGSNQENGAYPSGLCAERVAAFSASALYPGVAMTKIAISARNGDPGESVPVSPCGACRQVLLEYETSQKHPMKILLTREHGKVMIIENAGDMLPLSFLGHELKRG